MRSELFHTFFFDASFFCAFLFGVSVYRQSISVFCVPPALNPGFEPRLSTSLCRAVCLWHIWSMPHGVATGSALHNAFRITPNQPSTHSFSARSNPYPQSGSTPQALFRSQFVLFQPSPICRRTKAWLFSTFLHLFRSIPLFFCLQCGCVLS